ANIVPREMSELVAAMLRGDYERARELHFRLMPLFEAMFLETNPIPVKKAAELLGLANGTLRLPLAELSEENEERLRAVLKDLGLLK
ncbi:MAG: dihydrodipicolinate synthase family protein, partial [Candidatus Alkanophagales archaeon]